MRRLRIFALASAVLGLQACAPGVQAPVAPGVCFHMVRLKQGQYKFFPVASNTPDLEHCAAALEAMRIHFLSLGGSHDEVDGAYQGQFLFIDRRGVYTASDLNSTPFPALMRTGDGRLATQGAASDE